MADEQIPEPTLPPPPLMSLMSDAPATHHELPDAENGPYFIALKDGYKMVKQTHWGKVMVPAPEVPTLPEYKAKAILWYPEQRIDSELIAQVWNFFLKVFKDIGSEAMVYITHKDGQYRFFVPPQKVTKVAVKANFKSENVGDWQVVGTIHSHCDFGAHHSATDNHDADGMDGLHITIGNVNSYKPTVAIMISVNKMKWNLQPDEIFSDGMPKEPVAHPEWWERYVEKDAPAHMYGGNVNGGGGKHTSPPPQAPAGRGKGKSTQSNRTSATGIKRKQKNDKTVQGNIEDLTTGVEEIFDVLSGYRIWDGFTAFELDKVRDDLQTRWEDLASDLASIGIWSELATMPIWNVAKSVNTREVRMEMHSQVQKVLGHRPEIKSTDDRDWVPDRTREEEDYLSLLGES